MAKTTRLILEILNAEKERLFQYASYRLHNVCDVEDVLQNLYVKVLENPHQLINVENKQAYIFRIVSNECTDILRRKANVDLFNNDMMALLDIESFQPESFDDEFKMINCLLGILPLEQSEVIRLRLHGKLSFQQIADVMNVPLSTAKARYRYGIEKIRDRFKKHNVL